MTKYMGVSETRGHDYILSLVVNASQVSAPWELLRIRNAEAQTVSMSSCVPNMSTEETGIVAITMLKAVSCSLGRARKMRLRMIDSMPTRVNANTLIIFETERRSSAFRVAHARRKARNITTSIARQRNIIMATTVADALITIIESREQYAPLLRRIT